KGIKEKRDSIEIQATAHSESYLKTKAKKMGHIMTQFSGTNPSK
ncbi:MAG: hypothetical protein JWQ25_2515, partial [Daejeonella sp.]|nr:hypothetical protein [Daejeonella sp.]